MKNIAKLIPLVLLISVFGYGIWSLPTIASELSASKPQKASDPSEVFLSAEHSSFSSSTAIDLPPPWLLGVVAFFTALQLLSVFLAAAKSEKAKDSQVIANEVQFLCEVPMFLGLLGSLVGVCLTQFVTGSLAAPVAYLTTIFGIVMYLYARYAFALSFPESNSG